MIIIKTTSFIRSVASIQIIRLDIFPERKDYAWSNNRSVELKARLEFDCWGRICKPQVYIKFWKSEIFDKVVWLGMDFDLRLPFYRLNKHIVTDSNNFVQIAKKKLRVVYWRRSDISLPDFLPWYDRTRNSYGNTNFTVHSEKILSRNLADRSFQGDSFQAD